MTRFILKERKIKNNIILLAICIVSIVFYLTGCNREVLYEEVALKDAPEQVRANLKDAPSGSTGMAEIGNEAYAIIIGETGQEIEVVTVSRNFDVNYRIKDISNANSERPIKIINFKNNGSPVGFSKVN